MSSAGTAPCAQGGCACACACVCACVCVPACEHQGLTVGCQSRCGPQTASCDHSWLHPPCPRPPWPHCSGGSLEALIPVISWCPPPPLSGGIATYPGAHTRDAPPWSPQACAHGSGQCPSHGPPTAVWALWLLSCLLWSVTQRPTLGLLRPSPAISGSEGSPSPHPITRWMNLPTLTRSHLTTAQWGQCHTAGLCSAPSYAGS